MSGQMESVRRNYGVPAYRGALVTYRGDRRPLVGRIISSTGSHLYLRDVVSGRRSGPYHPTWMIDYGDGRDYTAECSAIDEVRVDWLRGAITNDEYRTRVREIRLPGEGE